MDRKKKILYVVLFTLVYVLVLMLLVLVESDASGASIKNFSDAFWYSVATITTVGYGDFYPVTNLGRLLGLFFMILSVGFFAFVIDLFVRRFSSKVLPFFKLKFIGKKNHYIFDEPNQEALFLADSILEKDKDAFVLFSGQAPEKAKDYKCGKKAVFAQISVNALVTEKRHRRKLCIFSMGERGYVNYEKALTYKSDIAQIYCEAPIFLDDTPSNISIFNKFSNVSRFLWKNYPLRSDEKTVVIVGCNNVGNEIIEQALLVNVDYTLGEREYHIFGNIDRFRSIHSELDTCFGINEKVEGKDSLFFHSEEVYLQMELLSKADRIMLCDDDDSKNLEMYNVIYKYCGTYGRIFAYENSRINRVDKSAVFFGADDSILTYDIIVDDILSAQAKQMHESYRASNPNAETWEQLSVFKRCSNMAVADHMATKIRMLLEDEIPEITEARLQKAREIYGKINESGKTRLREIEHERWMRFHILNNWKYSEVRCDGMRLHNLILPFDELSLENQKKDDYAWETL